MSFTFTMVDRETGQTANVFVDGDETRPVGTIVAEAERLIATDVVDGARTPTYFVGERPLDLGTSIAASGVRDGVVVARAAEPIPPRPLRTLSAGEVRIVSGPHAGTVARADQGVVAIGSGQAAALRIGADEYDQRTVDQDPGAIVAVPEIAVLVTIGADGATVRPVNGFDGAKLDGEPLTEEVDWPESAQLEIGRALLGFGRPHDRGAHLTLADDGMALEYNRPPRILPPEEHTRYALPMPPTEPPARALPILMALAPMGMAVMFVATTGRWYYMFIALLSPILMIITGLQGKRQGKKTYRQRVVEYEDTKRRIEADAEESLQHERARWIASAPDPTDVYETAVAPLPRLWERRRTDPDHLLVRVGTATQQSEVTIEDPEQLSHKRTVSWDARDVPVRIRLAERGVIGIAGPGDDARQIANWVVAQLATLQSPKDVRFMLLTDSTRTALWEWMSWLPHVRNEGADRPMTSIASTAATTARTIAELSALIDARKEAGVGPKVRPSDEIVVLMDGARRLRAMPSLVHVLKEGPSVGIFSICLDLDERLLPEECDAVVVVRDGRVRVRQQRTERIDDARPDLVDQDWLEWVARSLSPIVDASPDVEDGSIPSSSRLLDVLGLEPPTSEGVQARWLLGGRSTTAVIGESIDGAFAIDLRNDGPHGLIAGTTGSGKSELLQSIVASLAAANRPDEMNFVLVDYKGGAAFKDCVDLPHTVGMVTDLDTHQVERALDSLGAELRTREHALALVGAKDLEDYQDLQAKRAGTDAAIASMPRLLIVIDEFASLARELPDFVKGLVNIAQRGRSLGIHLILATQRPGGVVSPEIRANTNLRIALRVTDQSESQDVIGANDAARIAKSTPGRAYVRLGAASLLPFQAGRVGGRRPDLGEDVVVAPMVRELTFSSLSEPAPRRAQTEAGAGDVEITDLAVLVDAIQHATVALGTPEQRKPWLPPLPGVVGLSDIEDPTDAPLAVAFGLEDHPTLQEQRPTVFDLAEDGHMFVIGSQRSGRSQTLRTLAGTMGLRLGVGDVHLYGIDCGNGALLPIDALPHCGAVVQRHEPERVARLLGTLAQTVRDRQSAFASGGYTSITEQREAATAGSTAAGEVPLPHIVVFIDQWEGFMATLAEAENGALLDAVQSLLREGTSVGVHLVVSGDRTLTAGRMSSQVERKLLLSLADRGDYNYEGINGKKLPDEIPPGRGFRNGTATETQVAVLPGGTAGRAQAAALREIGAEVASMVPSDAPRPFRVDALPRSITFAEAVRYLPPAASGPGCVGIGVGGDELTFHTHDFVGDTPAFVVGGSSRSGKSTLLQAMARHVLSTGGSAVVVAPRDSPLRALDGFDRCTVFTDAGVPADALQAAIDAAAGFALVLVDDAELLKESAAEPVFRAIIDSDRGRRVGLVIAGDTEGVASGFRGWQVDAKKFRRGALLAPLSTVDGDLIGTRLTKSLIAQDRVAGRAFLNDADQTLRVVQVPSGD